MRILLCHNYYQQRGGEDQSFEDEAALLQSRGHIVVRYTLHNDDIPRMNRWAVAGRTLFNGRTFRNLRRLIRQTGPELMHCTNTFPLISPSAYYAARAEGVPVVQSLRNFRLLCCNPCLLRNGRLCEDCVGKRVAWPGVLHACYRQSRVASAVVVAMQAIHRALGTWTRAVDLYITASQFTREKMIQGGLPAEKIAVKPNFVASDPGPASGAGGYAVFVGRLSPEKGIGTLLEAWSRIERPAPLTIVGDGPLAADVREAARRNANIKWLGHRPMVEVLSILGNAACLVMPSLCCETFGRSIIEAFARGTPVVVSRLGAMSELVEDGCTGLHVSPGDAGELASKVERLLSDRARLAGMRCAARSQYEAHYTAAANYRLLLSLYGQVLGRPIEEPDMSAGNAVPVPRCLEKVGFGREG